MGSSEFRDDAAGRTDNLGQGASHVRRQVQGELDPARLHAEDVYFGTAVCVEELQSPQQTQPVQGMSLAGLDQVLAAIRAGRETRAVSVMTRTVLLSASEANACSSDP